METVFVRRVAVAVAGVVLLLAALPVFVEAQDMPRVRRTIRDLAAPALHGRGYVRRGDQKAASYLRRRFRQAGLLPLAPDYTQAFPLTINTFPGTMQLRVDGKELRPGYDFIAESTSGGGQLVGSPVAFDTLVFTDAAARRRWLHAESRTQLLLIRLQEVQRLRQLPPTDSLRRHLEAAAALITLVPRKLTASLDDHQTRQLQLQVVTERWPALVRQVQIRVTAKLIPRYQTQNLVGYVPGRIHPDSFLVVTAHYDHLGQMGGRTYFPGANDNASGTAMLLELAAHYARPENRPAYSIVFIAFGAEEAGLVGSRYFVEHPLMPLQRIRFLVNLDLLGTGSEGLTVVNGRELPAQFQLLQRLNEARQAVPSLAARGRAANSDHFPFSEQGIPAFFLYTRGGITAYHDVHDRPETLPLTAFLNVFGLIRDFLNVLGAQSALK